MPVLRRTAIGDWRVWSRACYLDAAGRGDRRRQGRLAQLVEHLVYTERVGGSSPSPPTSFRLVEAVSARCGVRPLAVAVTPAAAQEHGSSMSFRVAPLESHECGRHCPDVIVADGVIEAQTPQAFVNFLKSGSSDFKVAAHRFFQLPRRQCRRFNGLRSYSAGTAHRWRRRTVRGGRRSRTICWGMSVGMRLRADGRCAPRRASRERGRAASNVDCREVRAAVFSDRM